MRQNHLVIMVKLPRAGCVKTRLARSIGAAEAVRVYRAILARTIRTLGEDTRWQTWLAVSPDASIFSSVWPASVNVTAQGPGDLGARMQRVFDDLPTGPVVIIGSDIPGIAHSDIAKAFVRLGENDAVFGPAADGGYWLVGARRMPGTPKLFKNVRWSSEHALADTLGNLKGKRIGMLRELADLDEVDDYRRWRAGL